MATYRYVVADVFTDTPLTGNQLAVFTDARGLSDDRMQALAREIGFSETVFVLPAEADGNVRIRIFTPLYELPFAGHPTLGSAFVLGAPLSLAVIGLETGRGTIPVELERDESGRIVFGWMQQPVPAIEPYDDVAPLFAALRIEGSELPVELYDNGATHVFVALPSEDAVAAMRPDVAALAPLEVTGVNCFAGLGRPVEVAHVLAAGRGRRHGLGGRAARLPPRASRPHPLGSRDRDLARCGDQPAVDAPRARRGRGRPDRPGQRRRSSGDGGARRVQAAGLGLPRQGANVDQLECE